MQNKVFVGSLPFKTTSDELNALFSKVGTVTSALIPTDKMTGRSKGFGFVEFATEEDARAAVEKLNGSDFEGRTLFVDLARPRQEGGFNKR